jgi:hypothetical protein
MNTELLRRPFRRRGDPLRPQGSGVSLVNDLKAAASDALKKCMSLLGVSLELYSSRKNSTSEPSTRRFSIPRAEPRSRASVQALK